MSECVSTFVLKRSKSLVAQFVIMSGITGMCVIIRGATTGG